MSIVAELEEQLRWKTRSIALIREIDRLRDKITDEQELTSAFMSRLSEEATGATTVGNFGSVKRLEYTVIGQDVNLAARLCAVAAADQILISEATYRQVDGQIIAEELPPTRLKGIEFDVRSWNVRALR